MQANTLQLLRAFAVFANGGYLIRPTLVRKIVKRDEKGNETILHDPFSIDRLHSCPRVLSETTCKQVIDLTKYVTARGGAGHRAAVGGYTEFGKTSTEEKLVGGKYMQKSHYSSFLGGVIAEDPPFLIAVTIDDPAYGNLPGIGSLHQGSFAAAPIFRSVARRSLEYLGTPMDDPYGFPVGDPRRDPEKAHWEKEARLLQEKYQKWNKCEESSGNKKR